MTDLSVPSKVAKFCVAPTPSNAIDLALAVLPKTQAEMANAAYDEIKDEVMLDANMRAQRLEELVKRLTEKVTGEHVYKQGAPTYADVANALQSLGEVFPGAGGHRKRQIIFNAFFSRFRPEFYESGLQEHFWRLACAIEYPEARLLWRFIGRLRSANVGWMPLEQRTEEEFLGRKLAELGLLVDINGTASEWRVSGIAEKFREFIWSHDLEFADSEEHSPAVGVEPE